jgi:hypothetical protein
MIKWGVRGAVVGLISVVIVALGGQAADARTAATPVGNDVSYPQCGKALPSGQAFGIVGVNDGLANTTNPCFRDELAWATRSVGGTTQPRAALYVNTANPGHLGSWWPTSNNYPAATDPVPNPYGDCTGGDDAACAFVYGYAKAYDDGTSRGVPTPASYFWWYDVETTNSWGTNTAANRADLEGMTYYFTQVLHVVGVGIYSTTSQWTTIVGSVGTATDTTAAGTSASTLNNLPSWIAGARTLTGARANCTSTPLTGGAVTVTQYVSKALDYDYACP